MIKLFGLYLQYTDLLTVVLSAIERNDHRTETGKFWGAEYDLMRCAIWR